MLSENPCSEGNSVYRHTGIVYDRHSQTEAYNMQQIHRHSQTEAYNMQQIHRHSDTDNIMYNPDVNFYTFSSPHSPAIEEVGQC